MRATSVPRSGCGDRPRAAELRRGVSGFGGGPEAAQIIVGETAVHTLDHLKGVSPQAVEVSGWKKKEKEAKVETAKTLWVPAVNNEGVFGRWGFLEVTDTSKAMQAIRKFLASGVA
jgi:hypothetical protein